MFRLTLTALAFLSSSSFADTLALNVEAKNLFVKGNFSFQPGSPIKISGKDTEGKPYQLEILSELRKDNFVQFVCKLVHNKHKSSVSVIAEKGSEGAITSGTKDETPDIKFAATWIE